MTNAAEDNPYQPPENGGGPADYELPEQLELYPICVVTGSLEDLRKVTQTIDCGPWPLRVSRRCANLTAFLFLGQTVVSAVAASLQAVWWFLLIASGALVISLACAVVWRALRDRTTVTFFVTEAIWRKERRRKRLWVLGAVGLIGALNVFTIMFPPSLSGARNIWHTLTPTLLLLAVYVSVENAFQNFSTPALVRYQGQPMLRISRVYQDMAEHVEESAETGHDNMALEAARPDQKP